MIAKIIAMVKIWQEQWQILMLIIAGVQPFRCPELLKEITSVAGKCQIIMTPVTDKFAQGYIRVSTRRLAKFLRTGKNTILSPVDLKAICRTLMIIGQRADGRTCMIKTKRDVSGNWLNRLKSTLGENQELRSVTVVYRMDGKKFAEIFYWTETAENFLATVILTMLPEKTPDMAAA